MKYFNKLDQENAEHLNKSIQKHYVNGIIQGMIRFAWWKDGVEYVGSGSKTLKQAIAEVQKEYLGEITNG